MVGGEGLRLRVIQREKKSGSSIMQPHNLNCPSIVVVYSIGPELVRT